MLPASNAPHARPRPCTQTSQPMLSAVLFSGGSDPAASSEGAGAVQDLSYHCARADPPLAANSRAWPAACSSPRAEVAAADWQAVAHDLRGRAGIAFFELDCGRDAQLCQKEQVRPRDGS